MEKKAGSQIKTKTEIIKWCEVCSKAVISNRKKKCCGEDLKEVGYMETLVYKQID